MTDHSQSPQRPPRLVLVAIDAAKAGDVAIASDGTNHWTIDVDEHGADAIRRNPAKPEIGLSIVAVYRLTTDPADDPIGRLEEWRVAGEDCLWEILGPDESDPSFVVRLCNHDRDIESDGAGPTLSAAVDEALAKAEGRA